MTHHPIDLHDAGLADIEQIRQTYRENRFVFIDGGRMRTILRHLGATDQDIEALPSVGNHLAKDPTLPFRESRNGRFCFDFERDRLSRLEFQPFMLTKDEDFVRHDSGTLRCFRGIQDELQLNTAFQALMRFQAKVCEGMVLKPRPKLDRESARWVSTVFHLRTITTPELVGEPALEGVHSDGVEHTMTTLVGRENLTADSAISRIHDARQKNGTRWNEADPEWVVGQAQHRDLLDTLLIVDSELKHSVSPVEAEDPAQRATRDMLILFTRRPTGPDHSTHPYDSLNPHPEIPFECQLR